MEKMKKYKNIKIYEEDHKKLQEILLEMQYRKGRFITFPDVVHMIIEFYLSNKEK